MNRSCYDFVEVLSSKEPTPGGGGAAALVAAIGCALGSMVGNLTTGKKKYAEVESDIQELLEKSQILTERLEGLVQADAEAFAPLAAAYGLPADSEEDKNKKDEVIQAALIGAASVPLEIAESAVEALKLMLEFALKGSRLAVSDAGCGAAFCGAAIRAAELNVLINLKLMKDIKARDTLKSRLDEAVAEGAELEARICTYVKDELSYE